jgi:hypothetical protein
MAGNRGCGHQSGKALDKSGAVSALGTEMARAPPLLHTADAVAALAAHVSWDDVM